MYYNVSVAPCNAPYWTRKLFSWHLLTFTCKSHFQKSEFVKAKSDSAKNVRVQTVLCEVPNAAVLWGEPTLRMSMRRLHLTKFDWRLELEHLNAIKTNPPVQEVEKKRFQPQAATSWWPHWSFWLAALSGSSWSCSQPPVGRWHISHNKIQGWTMPCEVWIYSEHKIHNTAHP